MRYKSHGIIKIASAIILALAFSVAAGCSLTSEQNDNYVSIPINTPLAPAPTETKEPISYNTVSEYIDKDALLNTVSRAVEGKEINDNSYCSYILNRYYISGICQNNNALATFFTDVYNAIATFEPEYELPQGIEITKDEMRTLMFALFDDSPELFHVSPSYTYYTRSEMVVRLEFTYTMTPDFYLAALTSTYAELDAWYDGYTGTYDYELELYMYDRLLERCTYSDTADHCRTPYGAIVLGKALCEGYSQAFMMAMQYNGIFCIQVGGSAENPDTGKSEPHAWNIVKIQGDYYQVDATWDDYDSATANSSLYAYFNITDAQMYAHRKLEDDYEPLSPPECTAQACSYYTLWGTEIGETTDIHDFLFTAIEAHAQSLTEQGGVMLLKLKFRDTDTYRSFIDNLYTWLQEWNAQYSQTSCRITNFSWRTIESMGVLWTEMYSSNMQLPQDTAFESDDTAGTAEPGATQSAEQTHSPEETDPMDLILNNAFLIPVP